MKRKLLAILLVLCTLFVFAACGSNDTTDEDIETSKTTEENKSADTQNDADAPEETDDAEQSQIPGTQDKALLKRFFGTWKYEEKDTTVIFNSDFTWSMYDADHENKKSGRFTLEDNKAYLADRDGALFMCIESVSTNQLVDEDGLFIYKSVS